MLIADDELQMQDLVASIIEELGYSVVRASNGEQAWHLVCERHPRIVLTDVMMPLLRGDDLCRRIKSQAVTAQIPVGLVTSLPASNLDHCGADGYLAKPFAIETLERLVFQLGAGLESTA